MVVTYPAVQPGHVTQDQTTPGHHFAAGITLRRISPCLSSDGRQPWCREAYAEVQGGCTVCSTASTCASNGPWLPLQTRVLSPTKLHLTFKRQSPSSDFSIPLKSKNPFPPLKSIPVKSFFRGEKWEIRNISREHAAPPSLGLTSGTKSSAICFRKSALHWSCRKEQTNMRSRTNLASFFFLKQAVGSFVKQLFLTTTSPPLHHPQLSLPLPSHHHFLPPRLKMALAAWSACAGIGFYR